MRALSGNWLGACAAFPATWCVHQRGAVREVLGPVFGNRGRWPRPSWPGKRPCWGRGRRPQFPQRRSVDCANVLCRLRKRPSSGMHSSSSAGTSRTAVSLHNFPPSASWRAASKVQYITLRASTLSIKGTCLIDLPFQRPVTEAFPSTSLVACTPRG
ncbi:hypothetical protein GWK47_035606 [Chionoecetes opilio]|uniref:Uncharacterized protein n=1 Tax=Chionoecetes opilio TaxID=41210 RepID=A0A8J4YFA7_CHIOP|nr:hypothetical protein GWK47_035606 [Chionoecetes opilio]